MDRIRLTRLKEFLSLVLGSIVIAGHVDFVFGAATAYCLRCHLHAWRDGYQTSTT